MAAGPATRLQARAAFPGPNDILREPKAVTQFTGILLCKVFRMARFGPMRYKRVSSAPASRKPGAAALISILCSFRNT
jgi:hypothetical protein